MNTNDNNDKVIDLNCECRSSSKSHCSGNIYIQPDKDKGKRLFYFNITDTKGNEDATVWLNPKQVSQLIEELKILVNEYK